EPWKTFFEPAVIAEKLSALGFSQINAWTPEELNQHYLANRDDGLLIGVTPTRLVLATV
ncbi:TPA: SAM-dependent methyltransferase, partial [Burkholderia vietnamiensis]|nr:SAM-dependent methyltransferase [Burkholderia vietnamiensis]